MLRVHARKRFLHPWCLYKDALAQAEGGRFILSPTAGPYDVNISDHAIANYLALIDAGIKYGKLNG